jgi:hypothetical protein
MFELFHEIIDVLHGRGLIDAGKRDDLKALVPAVEADVKADEATVEGQAAENVKTVESQAESIVSPSDEPA